MNGGTKMSKIPVIQDTLAKLKKKRKELMTVRHPLYFMSEEDKVIYCAALFLQLKINENSNPLNHCEYNRLLVQGLCLPSDIISKIFVVSKDKQGLLEKLLKLLDNQQRKFIFMLDLTNLCMKDNGLSDEEKEASSIFGKMLNLTPEQMSFIQKFIFSAYYEEIEQCMKCYESMSQFDMDLTMNQLKYYVPSIPYINVIEGRNLKSMEEMELREQCTIYGTICVKEGTSLVIADANVLLFGQIVVDGGQLLIYNSTLEYKGTENLPLIMVKSYSRVVINKGRFLCNNRSGGIKQNNGSLHIRQSEFYDTNTHQAILFSGENAIITQCNFSNCYVRGKGAAIYKKAGRVNISQCNFSSCRANTGGAIYAKKGTRITDCKFKNCRALEFGNSIYFFGEIENRISHCMFETGIMDAKEVVQFIPKEIKWRVKGEKWLKYSTIFEAGFYVEPGAILNIENARILLGQPAIVFGSINMSRCYVAPYQLKGRDIIEISNVAMSEFENTVFDGDGKCSIFHATGTKLCLKNCILKNTVGGRAIYQCTDSKILNCIFSFCEEGGIYMLSGVIKDCKFINCRGDKGAGIEIKGNRTVIQGCKFVRCIARMTGGAIHALGGNQVLECAYKECKPNTVG